MTEKCPEYPRCRDRREADAEFRGKVSTQVENIERNVIEMRGDIKGFRWKIGLLAGGAGAISGIIGTIVSSHFK